MLLFESEVAKVEYDPTVPCVIWTPLGGFMKGEQFYEPFRIGMDFFEQTIKSKPDLGWLNDTRKIIAVWPADVLWLNENVNNRAYKAGGKRVAFVQPDDVFGKMSVQQYVRFTETRQDNQLTLKYFYNVHSAKLWLGGDDSVKEAKRTLI